MTHFDRKLQKDILTALSSFYPKSIDFETFNKLKQRAQTEHKLATNLFYLEENNLAISGIQPTSDESFYFDYKEIRLTAKGLDLLANDGGIKAILNCDD